MNVFVGDNDKRDEDDAEDEVRYILSRIKDRLLIP